VENRQTPSYINNIFRVLEVILSTPLPITQREIATQLELPEYIVRRILIELVNLKYIEKLPNRTFTGALDSIRLSQNAIANFKIPKLIEPILKDRLKNQNVDAKFGCIYRNNIIYVYDSANPVPIYEKQIEICQSCMATVILAHTVSLDEAIKIFSDSLNNTDTSDALKDQQLTKFKYDYQFAKDYGYLEKRTRSLWTIAFPVKEGNHLYALELSANNVDDQFIDNMILEGSLLATKLSIKLKPSKKL
jgi:DNA-binding IclR family transcriptional regulator